MTVPFRAQGSVQELTDDLGLFQWHYSPETLVSSFIAPSGLTEQRRLLYGERLPFDAWTRRLPAWLDWTCRPWDTAISALLLRPVADQRAADAVLLLLRKPDGPVDATDRAPGTPTGPRSARPPVRRAHRWPTSAARSSCGES